jgi:hypothetical protein
MVNFTFKNCYISNFYWNLANGSDFDSNLDDFSELQSLKIDISVTVASNLDIRNMAESS